MDSRAFIDARLTSEVEVLLARTDRDHSKDFGSELTDLADRVEISGKSHLDDLPMEIGDAVFGIDTLERATAAELRRIAWDPDGAFEPRLRASLLVLRRCGRMRRFQRLRAVWLENLGEGD